MCQAYNYVSPINCLLIRFSAFYSELCETEHVFRCDGVNMEAL